MTICPDFGLPARIWFSLPGFYFPSPDLTLAIHILPSLPAVDSTCWKCTLPAQIWVFLLRFHYSARIWLSLPYFESICRMYFSLQDFNIFARIWLFILGYDYLPWFWSPSTNLIFASWVLLSLPWFDSRYPYFTLFTRSWLHLLEVYSSCPNLSLSAEISLFCSDLTLPALFWIHLPDVFLLQDFNIFARIWLFILGYDYLPWFWSPSTNLIFASWVLLSLPWFDSRYPYFTLFTRSWLHLLEVYSSCPNLSLSAEISLFCSDLTLPALFWIHVP